MDSRRQADSSIIPRRALVIAFSVLVGCSSGDSDPMTDTAKAVHPPNPPSQAIQVEAGSDQVVHVGETVQLSGSTTAQSNHNIQWHFTSVPAGSTAELLDADTLMPRFVPDLAGLYVVALVKNMAQSDEVTSRRSGEPGHAALQWRAQDRRGHHWDVHVRNDNRTERDERAQSLAKCALPPDRVEFCCGKRAHGLIALGDVSKWRAGQHSRVL